MNRRSEYFELIDKYLNNDLTQEELSELEFEIKLNSELAEEFKLQSEVQQAVKEQDIILLRNKMNAISNNQEVTNNEYESVLSDSYNFGLIEELSSAQNFKGKMTIEDLTNYPHPFPKIHLYQHIIAAKENIYQFYKEQIEYDTLNDQEAFSEEEEALFEDIKISLKEIDLLDLRANLNQIATTTPDHSYSLEEISKYVNDEMDREQRIKFEEILEFNIQLAKDVQLYIEIDHASAENDIINLRASLQKIQKAELQPKFRLEDIEGYINNELTEQEVTLFEAKLAESKELISEIELVENINNALQENDIMRLRGNLKTIALRNEEQKLSEQSIAIRFRSRIMIKSIAAASLIILMGITGLLSRYSSEDRIYKTFYSTYETKGISRSSNTMNNQTLALALSKFNNKDYESALNLLQEVISTDQNNIVGHFFSGVSHQELGKYKNAIEEYEVVVNNKDNLFIEQAEWYIGLCYIQTKEDKKAIKQFKKIAGYQGFYQQNALAILRKMNNKL